MNDQYSDAFKSIVPESPSPEGWADGARRKRRNRGRIVGGVAAAAAVALIVPFALTLSSNSTLIATPGESESPSTENTNPEPDPATDAPGAAACWEAPMQARQATAEGATDGAVRAWLCGDAGVSGISVGAVGPQEPLVDGVDEVVDFIQSQQTLDESGLTACTEEYTLTYRIVLDYADGSSHVVPGALHGCRTIDDGPTVRTGGQELYDLALDLWRDQRAKVNAPSGGATVKFCPPPSRAVVPNLPPPLRPVLPLAPEEAVSGFACVENGESEDWSRYSTTLEPDLVSLIAGSVAADSVEGLGESHLPTLVTITGPWGEALTLQRTPDDTFQWFDAGTPMLWEPPADVLAQLDAALQVKVDEPVTSPEPGDQNQQGAAQPEGCEGVTWDDSRVTELEAGALPTSPERIWLCAAGSTDGGGPGVPWEPLASAELKAEAIAAFNSLDLAKPDRVCTMEAGSPFLVVHEYPDGTRSVVEVQLFGCGDVVAGDQVRVGGRTYFDTLLSLWQEQRRADPPVQERQGPLCPRAYSVFDIDPRNEKFTSGTACVGWEYTDGELVGPAEEVPLSADLLARVTEQLVRATPDVKWERLTGDNIVLVTAAGDPVTLQGINGGAFLVSDGASEWFWSPTGTVADDLATIFGS